MLKGALVERLRTHFQDQLFDVSKPIRVVETQSAGEAELECVAPPGSTHIQWRIERANLFPFLRATEAADGNLLIQCPDGTFEAHIVECKRTINQDTWSKAMRQMRWSLVRMLALCGILGVPLKRVVCYTAYREDRLSPVSSLDPALGKLPIGEGPSEAEIDVVVREQYSWFGHQIELDGVATSLRHVRVQLDPAGKGTVHLDTTADTAHASRAR